MSNESMHVETVVLPISLRIQSRKARSMRSGVSTLRTRARERNSDKPKIRSERVHTKK